MLRRIQSMHDGLAVIAAAVGASVAAVGAVLGVTPAGGVGFFTGGGGIGEAAGAIASVGSAAPITSSGPLAPLAPLGPLAPITHVDPLAPWAPLTAFNGQAIFDDEHLRLISLVGALGGAVVNLWLFDSPLGVKFMARKVSCSTITGVICTPIAVHWLGIVPNVDNLLAVSFLMAIVSVGLLRSLLPVWTRLVTAKLGGPVLEDGRDEGVSVSKSNASATGNASAPANLSVPDHRPSSVESEH